MNNLKEYILEKFKINKNSVSSNGDAYLIGTKVLLCIFTNKISSSLGGLIDCSIEEICDVTDTYIKIKGNDTKYTKNELWRGNKDGYQIAYAKNKSKPEQHIILPKEAIHLLNEVNLYGDRAGYCGSNYNLTKEEAENMLNNLKEYYD